MRTTKRTLTLFCTIWPTLSCSEPLPSEERKATRAPIETMTLGVKPADDLNKVQNGDKTPRNPFSAKQIALAKAYIKTQTTLDGELIQDFNQDGRNDLALVISSPNGAEEEGDRLVVIGLADKDNKSFTHITASSCLAMCKECGGMMGDPFMGIEPLGKSSAVINNYGGSRHRWSVSYTIAWRKNQFLVVGYDTSSFDAIEPNASQSISMNLLNGKYTKNKSKQKQRHHQTAPNITDCSAIDKISPPP